ncbi:MAG: PIN domain-containing protein [Candidatus Edwardsbacteria bacterium]
MYLVDSNVWIERLLEQEHSEDVRLFLDATPSEQLCITDFSFHSIGLILWKLNQMRALSDFVKDAFIDGAVLFIHLEPEDTQRIIQVMQEFQIDFDDAYQYVAAEKYSLTIVSFDSDFDRTERRRKSPIEVVKG